MAMVGDVFSSEKFYLCDMFGEDSRFVEFKNLTGRFVRLSGRLEVESLANMSWTTSVIVNPGETHKWRFLGGNRQDDFTMLSLLPEPYLMSVENKFTWTAEYLDLDPVDGITFNNVPGCLRLKSLPLLNANQSSRVYIRRSGSQITNLRKLAADSIITNGIMSSLGEIEKLQIPRVLIRELAIIFCEYDEMLKKRITKCDKCLEIHHHL